MLQLYKNKSLPFWDEEDIKYREYCVNSINNKVQNLLLGLNSAWTFHRIESPVLIPRNFISDSYNEDDIFITNHIHNENYTCLRPETTKSSYLYLEELIKKTKYKPPICVWQLGKSFRMEKSDGASASKLRFNEFYQLEFQCAYREDTKCDYKSEIINEFAKHIETLCRSTESRVADSDRLPEYSIDTKDVEVLWSEKDKFFEICSVSTRKDFEVPENVFSKPLHILEIAVGIDRILNLAR